VLLRVMINQATRSVRAREEAKSLLVTSTALLRRAFLAVDAQLVQQVSRRS
jgi:hypothetical protein